MWLINQLKGYGSFLANNVWRVLATVLIVAIVAVSAGMWAYRTFYAAAEITAPPENPFPDASDQLVVLGDSFAAGEGARHFFEASKVCHRTWQSYAYTIAQQYELGLSFHACAGAVINDLDHQSSDALPPQIDALKSASHVKFVLVQVGGNDAKFGDLVAACLKANYGRVAHKTPCAQRGFEKRLPHVENGLIDIYGKVKAAANGAPVFVMDYPNPFGPTYCTASQVSRGDWGFLTKTFIPELDNSVQQAASAAGVHYVSMRTAFSGFALCELPVGEAALNTISYLSNVPRHDSFHPNAVGHLLMANRIESVLRSNGINLPSEGLRQATSPTTTPAAPIPQVATLPARVDTSPCHAGSPPGTLYPASSDALSRLALTGLLPSAVVCYQGHGGTWQQATADAAGNLVITTTAPSATAVEVIFRDKSSSWTRSIYHLPT